MQKKTIDLSVGLLVILAVLAMFFIAVSASGVEGRHAGRFIKISADFDNVSGLRVRAPVKVSGVWIGEVSKITLDPQTYRAHVQLKVAKNIEKIPMDSEAKVLTEGLLGSKYISIIPGMSQNMLANGGQIPRTTSAMILEDLVGKLMFSLSKK